MSHDTPLLYVSTTTFIVTLVVLLLVIVAFPHVLLAVATTLLCSGLKISVSEEPVKKPTYADDVAASE